MAELTLQDIQAQITRLSRRIDDLPASFGFRLTDALVSPNFSSGNSGWKIDEHGNVEFNDGNFRGDITGASGTFSGTITASAIDIGGTDATSWHVDSAGNMWWGAGGSYAASSGQRISNTGVIDFSSGTFSGTISAGTITGSTISGGSISGATLDIGGADSTSWHVDVSGNMWLGAASFNISTNPFAVSSAGVLRAVSGTIGGWTLSSSQLSGGSVIIDSSGNIHAGQSAWNSGTGWWLESASSGRFSVGSSSSNRFTWDGSELFLGLTTNGGFTIRMPSGSATSSSGLIIENSSGTGVLKINNNAFITSFGRPFAAASNTTGTFGSDWFNFFCEFDSVPGVNTGTIELPNTNAMLIKRSGGGAIIRIRSQSSTGVGKIDLFEPIGLRSRSTPPGSASSFTGFMYYDSAASDIVFSNGTNWYKVTATVL